MVKPDRAVWAGALIAATKPLSHALRRPPVVGWLDRMTGGMFIRFGLRLALRRGGAASPWRTDGPAVGASH